MAKTQEIWSDAVMGITPAAIIAALCACTSNTALGTTVELVKKRQDPEKRVKLVVFRLILFSLQSLVHAAHAIALQVERNGSETQAF